MCVHFASTVYSTVNKVHCFMHICVWVCVVRDHFTRFLFILQHPDHAFYFVTFSTMTSPLHRLHTDTHIIDCAGYERGGGGIANDTEKNGEKKNERE